MDLPRYESKERCSNKRGRAVDEEEEKMRLSKRSSGEWSCERGAALSELWCKDEEENFDPELIFCVMKSLADEIMCNENPCDSDSADISSGVCSNDATSNVDIEYLLAATDDELGIPPSPNTEVEVNNISSAIPDNSVCELMDNLWPELEGEGLLQLCNSEPWYALEEEDVFLLNHDLCRELMERSLSDDSANESSSPAKAKAEEQVLAPLLEAGAT
ncbi:hypothetical protein KI387_013004, partial [Taxus chinensis]